MPYRPWPILAAIAICLLLLACSSAPPTSQSNASFTDARNNFNVSDFKAALRNLDKVGKGTSDESQRQQAIVLRMVLVTALADANKQMAEAYYIGPKPPRAVAFRLLLQNALGLLQHRALVPEGWDAGSDGSTVQVGRNPAGDRTDISGFPGHQRTTTS